MYRHRWAFFSYIFWVWGSQKNSSHPALRSRWILYIQRVEYGQDDVCGGWTTVYTTICAFEDNLEYHSIQQNYYRVLCSSSTLFYLRLYNTPYMKTRQGSLTVRLIWYKNIKVENIVLQLFREPSNLKDIIVMRYNREKKC